LKQYISHGVINCPFIANYVGQLPCCQLGFVAISDQIAFLLLDTTFTRTLKCVKGIARTSGTPTHSKTGGFTKGPLTRVLRRIIFRMVMDSEKNNGGEVMVEQESCRLLNTYVTLLQ
jgi:hypothetical protein